MAHTAGFRDAIELAEHYNLHGADFAAATVTEYFEQADEFLGGPRQANTLECRRLCRDGSLGDICRFDTVTQAFGVLSANKVIRTYYVPNPLIHLQATNLAYFQRECRKVIC